MNTTQKDSTEQSKLEETQNLSEKIEEEIPYCTECKRTFSTKGNLVTHIKTIHQGIKQYACTFEGCNKRYPNRASLEVHLRNHLGQKPYQCDICFKCFNEKGNLKTHKTFHSTVRPYKCNICEKTYKTKGHLKDHIKVQHEKSEKFKCKECNKEFGRFSSLQSHLKSKHKIFYKVKSSEVKVCVENQAIDKIDLMQMPIKTNILETKENVEEQSINFETRPNSTFYQTIQNPILEKEKKKIDKEESCGWCESNNCWNEDNHHSAFYIFSKSALLDLDNNGIIPPNVTDQSRSFQNMLIPPRNQIDYRNKNCNNLFETKFLDKDNSIEFFGDNNENGTGSEFFL